MINKEEWLEVRDNPNYLVSNHGRVFSVRRNRLLATWVDNKGYIATNIRRDGRQVPCNVHRLVAEVFVQGWDVGLVVNHIDGNKQNNHDSNLEWCTYSDNMSHAHRTGLNSGRGMAVQIIETGQTFPSIAACAQFLNGSDGRIHDVISGKRPSYRKMTFRYVTER